MQVSATAAIMACIERAALTISTAQASSASIMACSQFRMMTLLSASFLSLRLDHAAIVMGKTLINWSSMD